MGLPSGYDKSEMMLRIDDVHIGKIGYLRSALSDNLEVQT